MDAAQITDWIGHFSYPAVLGLLLACGMGAPLSEDVILLVAGAVVARSDGELQLGLMAAVGWLGTLGGDFILFRVGRALGPKVTESPRLSKVMTQRRVDWVRGHFERHGALTVLFARFMPGFRAPTYLIAGMGGTTVGRFLVADGIGAAVTAPLVTWLGYRFGMVALQGVREGGRWIVGAILIGLVVLLAVRWGRRWLAARRGQGDVSGRP